MGFAIHGTVQHAANGNTDTTIDVTITVSAGDLVVVFGKHEGAATDTMSVARSAGGDAFTGGTMYSHTGGAGPTNGQFFYLISPSNTGSQTYRLTTSAPTPFKSVHAWCFTPDSGETVTFDQQTGATGDSPGATPNSGNITTTGTDEVALGGYAENTGNPLTTPTIGGVAADGSYLANNDPNFTASWYRILTATMTNGAAAGSLGGASAGWATPIIAFKSAAAGPTNTDRATSAGAGALSGIASTRVVGTLLTPVTP